MLFAQPQFAVRKSLQVSRNISSGAILDWGVRKMKAIIQSRTAVRALSITSVHLFLIFFLCLALPALASAQDPLAPGNMPAIDTTCADYPSNIWVTGPLSKVFQNSGTAGACPGTTGDKWITVFGTQNEFVDFQIHFHDSGSGTSGFQVTLSSFVQTSPNSFTISAPDSTHTDIVVYREAYMNVTTPSATPHSGTASNLVTWLGAGRIPDPLIPAIDPYYHQTTNAFPFNVAAGNNQSVWVDVHIPPTAPAGYYKGTATVQHGCPGACSTLATLPIVIGVWQWPSSGHMPSTASLQSAQFTGWSDFCVQTGGGSGNSGCSVYPGAGGNKETGTQLQVIGHAVMMLDHRLSAGNPVYNTTNSDNFASFTNYYAPLLNGTQTNPATILSGAKLTNSLDYNASERDSTYQQWMTEFQGKSWSNRFYAYPCDEPPNGCSWSQVISNGSAAHATTPATPLLLTANIHDLNANGAGNSVDIMVSIINDIDPCPTSQPGCFQTNWGPWSSGTGLKAATTSWLSGSCCGGGSPPRQFWSYLDNESSAAGAGNSNTYNVNWPNWQVDGTPVSNRAMEWLSFLHGNTGELYFASTICWTSNCAGSSPDPWTSVKYGSTWGDGTLVYPGRQAGSSVGSTNVGTTSPIWLPSVRLKMIRDGMQDFEYLHVLTNLGKGSAVQNAIASWITNSTAYNNTLAPASPFTSDLPDARATLGNTMHQLTYSALLAPPPTLTGTLQ